MNLAAMLLALGAGMLIALQFGVNAALRGFLGGNPLFATLVSYAVGTIASLCALVALRPALPPWENASGAPWWTWIGGAVGVGYVSTSIFLAPRLGATRLIVLVVTGQLLASVVFDHFGLLGYPVRPFNAWRGAGCVLLVLSILLIRSK